MGVSRNLLYFITDALRSIRGNLATTVLTSVTLGFSLSIFTLFLLIFVNLNAALNAFGERTHIVAYVKDGSTAPTERILNEILSIPGVKAAEYVSKERALKELKEGLKGQQGILEGIDVNPLPASFEIRVTETYRDPVLLRTVVERLKGRQWVEDVQWGSEWVRKFSSFLRFIEAAAFVVGAFLASATVFIITNTIRLTVYARRDEIDVLRLIGASEMFIRAPFFIEGVVEGFFGGALALAIAALVREFVLSNVPPYLGFITDLPAPAPVIAAAVVVSGVVMGAVGSVISMARFLKE